MDHWPPGYPAGDESRSPWEFLHELAARNSRGAELFVAGRHRDAARVFADVLAGCHRALGSDHRTTLTVAGNLGVAWVAAGRRRVGLAQLRSTLAQRVRLLGDDAPMTLSARDALAAAELRSGAVDDAVQLSRQVTGQRLRLQGPAAPDTVTSRMGLIRALAAAGDLTSAITAFNAALRDAEDMLGPGHRHTHALLECGLNSGLIHRRRWRRPRH